MPAKYRKLDSSSYGGAENTTSIAARVPKDVRAALDVFASRTGVQVGDCLKYFAIKFAAGHDPGLATYIPDDEDAAYIAQILDPLIADVIDGSSPPRAADLLAGLDDDLDSPNLTGRLWRMGDGTVVDDDGLLALLASRGSVRAAVRDADILLTADTSSDWIPPATPGATELVDPMKVMRFIEGAKGKAARCS